MLHWMLAQSIPVVSDATVQKVQHTTQYWFARIGIPGIIGIILAALVVRKFAASQLKAFLLLLIVGAAVVAIYNPSLWDRFTKKVGVEIPIDTKGITQ